MGMSQPQEEEEFNLLPLWLGDDHNYDDDDDDEEDDDLLWPNKCGNCSI